MTTELILYHHKNLQLAEYAKALSHTLAVFAKSGNLTVQSLPQQHSHPEFAELPTELRKLLFFARPDLVICLDDGLRPTRPVFAFELTDHVPAQDHWMQRFNHLVGCAQQGIPGAYVLPFAMPQHPKFPSSLDSVFFYAYDRVTEIHETPIFIAEWETVAGRTTKNDPAFPHLPSRKSADIALTFQFLERVLEAALHGQALSSLMKERLIVDLRNRVRSRAYSKIPEIRDFARLRYNMPHNKMASNREVVQWLRSRGLALPKKIPDRIRKRVRNLIFVPQPERGTKSNAQLREALLTRIHDKGGDPYLGQPLAFDYIFCRLGETPYERDANLIIDLGVLKFKDLAEYHRVVWQRSPLQFTELAKIKHVPTYTMHLKESSAQVLKNVLRIYAYAADIIVYEDGMIYF